ncbi:MAG: hypothetical protein ACRD68_03725, partial [Pyrinomonadaceae bacterium]
MTTGALKQPLAEDLGGESRPVSLPPTLLHHKNLLFNRELSWLEFNRRVLEEALDASHPLLERLKFLSIFSTNLDEFFMIRVSGLKEELDEDVVEPSPDGRTPAEQIREISRHLRPILAEHMRCLREEILPRLESEGITIAPYDSLAEGERRDLDRYFMDNVFPVLTPQAVDPSHPFPYISNRSLNIGLMIESAGAPKGAVLPAAQGGPMFARVKVPPVVGRLVPVGDSGAKFTYLGELIAANVAALFPG